MSPLSENPEVAVNAPFEAIPLPNTLLSATASGDQAEVLLLLLLSL
jgi:hypothetical protein